MAGTLWSRKEPNGARGPGDRGEPTVARKKKRKKISRRTLVTRYGYKYYVRRDRYGRFKNWVRVGRSLRIDKAKKARRKVRPGQDDRGDIRP